MVGWAGRARASGRPLFSVARLNWALASGAHLAALELQHCEAGRRWLVLAVFERPLSSMGFVKHHAVHATRSPRSTLASSPWERPGPRPTAILLDARLGGSIGKLLYEAEAIEIARAPSAG